ncbi:DUF4867 family protein [Alloiococcus sp. CFN-8]|uniref:DUF4867 family protein n=1 Tax=Alloiococcus sp. CFN-8 TaxID=3416081 RepID=UPI003CF874DC
MHIKKVTDLCFSSYGRVLEGYDVSQLLKAMEHTPLPLGEVIYEPSCEELEELAVAEQFQDDAYGGLPIQIGYCNGFNSMLNALEYHRSSEINVAVTDMILLVGKQQDISEDYKYATDKVEAFLVPAGTVVEMYGTTLHYAPCMKDDKGFRCVVILPRDTNRELSHSPSRIGEAMLLTAKNKWLIAHEDSGIEGAFYGLTGKNISLI